MKESDKFLLGQINEGVKNLHSKVDKIAASQDAHEERLDTLEADKNMLLGAARMVGYVAGGVSFLCATVGGLYAYLH